MVWLVGVNVLVRSNGTKNWMSTRTCVGVSVKERDKEKERVSGTNDSGVTDFLGRLAQNFGFGCLVGDFFYLL